MPDLEYMIPIPPEFDLGSPGSDTSEYHSCESSFLGEEEEEEEQIADQLSTTPNGFNDPEISPLNLSVFELTSLSEDELE